MRIILPSAITTSSSSPLPWPTVNNNQPKGFRLFCTTLKSACSWGTANKLACRLTQTQHCYTSRLCYTQTCRCRLQKVLLCFVATGSANFFVDDQLLPIPSFLSTFISWTSYSLPIDHIPYSHSFNEAYTQTSLTRSPLFYESISSSLLSLYVVSPSLFPPYLTCLLLVVFSSHHAGHPLCLVLCISRIFLLRMGVICGSGGILNGIILSNPSSTLQWLWVDTG